MTSSRSKNGRQRRRHDRQREAQAHARKVAAAAAAEAAAEAAAAEARAVEALLAARQARSAAVARRRTTVQAAVVGAAAALALLGGIKLLDGHDQSGQLAERAVSMAFAPPEPLRPGTSYVETRVLPSGDLQVAHWIRSRRPLSTILVSPPHVSVPGPLHVKDLKVVTRGASVPLAGGWATVRYPAIFNLDNAQRVLVTYLLAGSVQRDRKPAGRGVASVTSLTVRDDRSTSSTTHAVVGAHVLNLACSPATPVAVPQPCGAPEGDGWQVSLEGARVDDRVMAQLDLG